MKRTEVALGAEELFDIRPQCRVTATRPVQERRPLLGRVAVNRLEEDRFGLVESVGHRWNSRLIHQCGIGLRFFSRPFGNVLEIYCCHSLRYGFTSRGAGRPRGE